MQYFLNIFNISLSESHLWKEIQMIIFAIPLRAAETSSDWNGCITRFNQTLNSIFNQTNDSFKCIVACNEMPTLYKEYDGRLEFMLLDLPAPKEWIDMARDKFWKLTAIAVRIREILETQPDPEKGIYVMPVDADDLLNKNIAEYCVNHPDENGLVSHGGYVWKTGDKYIRKYPNLHTYCGSCNIIKMYRDDLPDKLPFPNEFCHDGEVARKLNEKYPIRFDHNMVVELYSKAGKPFSYLPFRSTIYVRNTGDNISCINQKEYLTNQKDRLYPIAFIRKFNLFKIQVITNRIKDDFGWIGK